MREVSFGLAVLLAAAIIVIGVLYLSQPRRIASAFGLPLPEEGPNIPWWLRLKGVRDVASGPVLFAVMALGLARRRRRPARRGRHSARRHADHPRRQGLDQDRAGRSRRTALAMLVAGVPLA